MKSLFINNIVISSYIFGKMVITQCGKLKIGLYLIE